MRTLVTILFAIQVLSSYAQNRDAIVETIEDYSAHYLDDKYTLEQRAKHLYPKLETARDLICSNGDSMLLRAYASIIHRTLGSADEMPPYYFAETFFCQHDLFKNELTAMSGGETIAQHLSLAMSELFAEYERDDKTQLILDYLVLCKWEPSIKEMFVDELFKDSWLQPKKFDWEAEWERNSEKLKLYTAELESEETRVNGNHDLPEQFDFPLDEGFVYRQSESGLTITYYLDRGLLDHYSAFIYTSDPVMLKEFDRNVENGGNDFKLEEKWYIIND